MPQFKLHPNVPHGAAKKGCYFCGLAKRAPHVRSFVEIDYEGEVVFCTTCAAEVAKCIGFASKKSVDGTKAENARVREQLKELEAENASLKEYRGAVHKALESVPDELRGPATVAEVSALEQPNPTAAGLVGEALTKVLA